MAMGIYMGDGVLLASHVGIFQRRPLRVHTGCSQIPAQVVGFAWNRFTAL